MTSAVSQRLASLYGALQAPIRYFYDSDYPRLANAPEVSDFAFGNPQEMALPGFVDALQKWSQPQNKDWFAYKDNDPKSQAIIAESLRKWRGLPFEADDIVMTTGAFVGLAATLQAVVDPGDEVIFFSPPWFFYESLILLASGVPVRLKFQPDSFDLDLDAIAAAITPRTRVILVNSPCNPTGKIYPPETLQRLADILTAASQRNGRTIYLMSDEAYSRIIFDGRDYPSPTAFYPNTFLIYTYGKTLLTPGQRMGYVALPPIMPHRDEIRMALFACLLVMGHAFPNALLQHALADIDKLSIDIEHLQYKRDWMVKALREMGYSVPSPEGTFYLLPRSPLSDDWAFCQFLAEHKILCLPGIVVEMPGYFRISLTASDAMIERALPGFAAAFEKAKATEPVM